MSEARIKENFTGSFVDKIDYRTQTAPQDFCRSLKETGFAIMKNTPIKKTLIDDVLTSWQIFFRDTPIEDKMAYVFDKNAKEQSGYFPFKQENAKGEDRPDLKEFFHLYKFTDIPEQNLSDPLKTSQLIFELKNFGLLLLRFIAEDIKNYSIVDTVAKSGNTLFRTIYYPALDEGQQLSGLRAAAHEDLNLITLLPAASESGLEVKDAKGDWHVVEYEEGDIVVNVGDMLQMMTDHEYISTTHRVQNPSDLTKDRVSMPMFFHPEGEYDLGPMTRDEYLHQRLKEIGLK